MNNQEERARREAAEKTMLPCPFCGGENLRIHRGAQVYYAYCTGCGACGGWGGGAVAAAEKWNKRHGEDQTP